MIKFNENIKYSVLSYKHVNTGSLDIGIFRYLFNTFLLFSLIFSIHFIGMPWYVSLRNIVILYIIFSFWQHRNINLNTTMFYITDLSWILMSLFICAYSWFIVIVNQVWSNQYMIAISTLNFFVFVVILPFFTIRIFKNAIIFCKCLIYACLIQSAIVITSFAFHPVRIFLESIQLMDVSRYSYRIIGLGIAGSGGSVYLLCGLIAAGYLFIIGENKSTIITSMGFIIIAIAFTGRTGFYAALAIILYLMIFSAKNIIDIIIVNLKMIVFLGIVIVAGYVLLINIRGIDLQLFNYTYDRLWELFREGMNSDALSGINNVNSPIPGLSFETIVGTGLIRVVTSSGAIFANDSGYIQRYAALGIIVCIVSYTSFYTYVTSLIHNVPKIDKRYLFFCLLLLFVIEYKEPFIYMLVYPFTLIMISRLSMIRSK